MPAPSAPRALPGHSTPAVGFDTPFEMLAACHERVTRSLRLLLRLADHLEHKGWDEPARQAARDVLRYFDLAAPLHHEDEERHVFPLVLGTCGDASLHDAVRTLQLQHEEMRALWAAVRAPLEALSRGEDDRAFDAAAREHAASFVALYRRHMPVEESLVFPFVAARLSREALDRIGAEMASRRGARVLPPHRP